MSLDTYRVPRINSDYWRGQEEREELLRRKCPLVRTHTSSGKRSDGTPLRGVVKGRYPQRRTTNTI